MHGGATVVVVCGVVINKVPKLLSYANSLPLSKAHNKLQIPKAMILKRLINHALPRIHLLSPLKRFSNII